MSSIVQTIIDDQTTMFVEATDELESVLPGQRVDIGADDVAERAAKSVEDAVARLQPALLRVAEKLKTAGPQEIEVSFGLKFSIGAFWFISARSDANFDVKVVWKSTPT